MSCNVCLVPAARNCSKCDEISYCSQEHQQNWSVHRLTCANDLNDMSSDCSSSSANLNQSKEQPQELNSPQQKSSSSEAIFIERLEPLPEPEEDSDNTAPIDENFDYTNHSHHHFRNLTENTMSIGEVNMLNPTGGPNLNFK